MEIETGRDVGTVGEALIAAVASISKEAPAAPLMANLGTNGILREILKKYDSGSGTSDQINLQIASLIELLLNPDDVVAFPWSLFYRGKMQVLNGEYLFSDADIEDCVKLKGSYFWCKMDTATRLLDKIRAYFKPLSNNIEAEICFVRNKRFSTPVIPGAFFWMENNFGADFIRNFQIENDEANLVRFDQMIARTVQKEEELKEWSREHDVQYRRTFHPEEMKVRRPSKFEETFDAEDPMGVGARR